MISTTNPKMYAAREAGRSINHVRPYLKGIAVADWAKKVHVMLGTKSDARVKSLELTP